MHGDDALLAAKEVFHTNSVIKYLGNGECYIAVIVLYCPEPKAFVSWMDQERVFTVSVLLEKVDGSELVKTKWLKSP